MPSRTGTSGQPPEVVIVTGANGFIAQHCVAALLRQGYAVVGTVRSEDKASIVRATHDHAPCLSVVIVEDITSTDALVARLAPFAATAILHLAAPFTYATSDYERDLMLPAVGGATAMLQAAAKMPSVRRFVQTNSFAGIYDFDAGPQPGKTYTSRDWSPLTYDDGVNAASAPVAYRASKAAAERAARHWHQQHDPHFDLVSLCPVMVFGAFLPGAEPTSLAKLNTSNGLAWAVVSAGKGAAMPPTRGPVWVDVRDVADAHVRSLAVPEAAGRRFLLAAGVYCNQEIADLSRARLPPKLVASRVPLGDPGQRQAHTHFGVCAREAEDILGMRWRALGDCLEGLVPQLYEIEQRGRA
jgi:nucleoside-diphosphate-sugar epimerase